MIATIREKQDSLNIPHVPAIPGLAFRRYRGDEDLPKMLVVFDRSNQADQIEEKSSLEQLSYQYNHLRNCDPYKDVVMAEADGDLIGVGRMWWAEEAEGDYVYSHFFDLVPEWRGAGIGTAVQQYMEAHMRGMAEGHPTGARKYFDAWMADTQPAKAGLLKRFGYEPERYFYEMTRDLSEPMPDAPMPAGLEVRTVEEAHYRKIWEAADEAFRDHWGHVDGTEEDYERWRNSINTLPHRDPKLWKVAWDGEEVTGMVLNGVFPEDNKAFNRKWGWTDPICVRRPWRKRGLARSLIVQSMVLLRDMGFEKAALGVDTKNPSGALRLYESCGYEIFKHWTVVRKPIS